MNWIIIQSRRSHRKTRIASLVATQSKRSVPIPSHRLTGSVNWLPLIALYIGLVSWFNWIQRPSPSLFVSETKQKMKFFFFGRRQLRLVNRSVRGKIDINPIYWMSAGHLGLHGSDVFGTDQLCNCSVDSGLRKRPNTAALSSKENRQRRFELERDLSSVSVTCWFCSDSPPPWWTYLHILTQTRSFFFANIQ